MSRALVPLLLVVAVLLPAGAAGGAEGEGSLGHPPLARSASDGPGSSPMARSMEGAEDIGLVDVDQGIWYLRDSDSRLVTTFFYGNPGDLPIVGDWDGDGDSTPGLYRQSDGFFYSRNSNTQGPADAECFAGDPADVPIAGDWDGDGDDNLGIYRPSEQKFYLFTATCVGAPMGAAQIVLAFGNPGDKPVAGDWDGDGVDEIGLHRESTGFFYWRNTLDTGVASDEIFFGDPNDRFVTGDWGVADDIDSPAIFRPAHRTFYFRHTLTQGNADTYWIWPQATDNWLPVAGEFGALKNGRRLPQADDPLGLVMAARDLRRYTQDDDHFSVWLCDLPEGNIERTLDGTMAILTELITPYFEALSGGVYRPVFHAGGSVSAAHPDACVDAVAAEVAPSAYESILVVTDAIHASFGRPDWYLEFSGLPPRYTFPGNNRHVVVGGLSVVDLFNLSTIPHEMGHTLHWPHSQSGISGSQYDNPNDLMSGRLDEQGFRTYLLYGTPVFNLYHAGWIDPNDVVVWTGEGTEMSIVAPGGEGTQMLVIPTITEYAFFTAGTRISSDADPIPESFEGVEVYWVDQNWDCRGCIGLNRRFLQWPQNPYGVEHVLQPGESVGFDNVRLTVLAREGDSFRVSISSG